MTEVKGNVCFFHRQIDNKWIWFIADLYGCALIKSVELFNTYEDAIMDYNIHEDELKQRLQLGDDAYPFKNFFKSKQQ